MDRYVAFLRGMNLGNRRLKNEELRAQFAPLGFAAVATFRASGNVIFDADDDANEGTLTEKIEARLGEGLGYEVPVFLRSAAELAGIAGREPFAAKLVANSKGKLQVSILAKKPSAKDRKAAIALATDKDLLAIEGRELYWLPSGGISESDLDLKSIDKALGKGTMRTMGTIEQIVTRYCAD